MRASPARLALLGLALLAACSPPAPLPPASGPVTVTITPDGGTLEATSPDGVRYALAFPEGAVSRPLEVTLDPRTASPGTLLSATLEPAGVTFARPVALEATLPEGRDPASAAFFFGDLPAGGGFPDVFPTEIDAATRTLSARITSLGLPAFDRLAPQGRAAQQNQGGNGNLGGVTFSPDCQAAIDHMQGFIDQLEAEGGTSFQLAYRAQSFLGTVIFRCGGETAFRQWLEGFKAFLRSALQDALTTMNAVAADDYRILEEIVPPVINWCSELLAIGDPADADCLPAGAIDARYDQFLVFYQAQVQSNDLPSEYWKLEQELKNLLQVGAGMQLVGVADAADGLLATVIPDVSKALLDASYQECIDTGVQFILWRLLVENKAIDLLRQADTPPDEFEDIHYCGTELAVEVKNHKDTPFPDETRDFDGGGQVNAGRTTQKGTRSPVQGTWTLSGDVTQLRCARPIGAEGFGDGKLSVRLAGTEIEEIQASNGDFFASPVEIDIGAALTSAGIDPENPGTQPLEVWRVGSRTTCSDIDGNSVGMLIPDRLLYRVDLELDPKPRITSVGAAQQNVPAGQQLSQVFTIGYADTGANLETLRNTFTLLPENAGGSFETRVDDPTFASGFGAASGQGTYTVTIFVSCDRAGNPTLREEFVLEDDFEQESDPATLDLSVNYGGC